MHGMTGMLVQDLKLMCEKPGALGSGPTGVMLGLAPAQQGTSLVPHPTLLPSTLTQDRAVASAMSNLFTVVTGPPGTGKSQVLVNTISAAVARGQKVLFASKNNQAVDVVFERLALTSDDPCIVRAGAKGKRGEVASRISSILAVPPKEGDASAARERWHEIRSEVAFIHAEADLRVSLEQKRLQAENDLQSLTEKKWQIEDSLRQILAESTPAVAEPEPAAAPATAGEEQPHNSVRRINVAPVMDVVAIASELIAGIAAEAHSHRPSRSRSNHWPATRYVPESCWPKSKGPLKAGDRQRNISEQRTMQRQRTMTWRNHHLLLMHQIRCASALKRTKSGSRRSTTASAIPEIELDASLRNTSSMTGCRHARTREPRRGEALSTPDGNRFGITTKKREWPAGQFAQHLRTPGNDFRLQRAHAQAKDALPLLPVWGVTNLSARTNFPLEVECSIW